MCELVSIAWITQLGTTLLGMTYPVAENVNLLVDDLDPAGAAPPPRLALVVDAATGLPRGHRRRGQREGRGLRRARNRPNGEITILDYFTSDL